MLSLFFVLPLLSLAAAFHPLSPYNFTSTRLFLSPGRQRHAATGAVSNTGAAYIFIAGGVLSTGAATAALAVLDVSKRQFLTPELQMSTTRDGAAIGSAHDVVAVAGGKGPTGLLTSVEVFNVTSMAPVRQFVIAARSDMVAVSMRHWIVFLGGRSAFPYVASADVDVLDVRSMTMSTFKLAESRAFPAAAALGDKIYVAGGDRNAAT
ncbi:MAG: hypothetical protein IV100_29450, partial [Myxococcales bacterium]|nr:hypothetical protein [Myxococcales bacterium]